MFAIAPDGGKIWYDHTPGERTVLLVHGFASDSARTWGATGWPRALGGHGVLAVDLRGHGHSQAHRPPDGFTPENLADDLLAVLAAAGVAEADVITYSMGGLAGWALARRAPGRVRRLVLGGLGARPASAADMAGVARELGATGLEAIAEDMAGHRIEGPAPVPALLAAGDADTLAPDAAELAAALGAPFVPLPNRNHFNALSSRAFKQAALEFLEAK
ncbi:alpha/beta hydrolase [Amycolatopsis cynarae]|uniref:Alpha/beta hydrolase n=1 Tax=Amycolatopsis cynarae TaxID=2995223 RepID=A0ABY7B275_9PSEU|nr:alpha/beta hydrolase [Amycolatopsis sp. HUAS 11-8]WAL66405.1 alpha/beta hydrolase [Amycolatopsis sp. HUAS 11-8]